MSAERAGYAHRALVDKLGIKRKHRLAIIGAPRGFDATLGTLPTGVVRLRQLRPSADVVLFFTRESRALRDRFAALKRAIAFDGMLWVCWPKRSSSVTTDLDENLVRAMGLAAGLVDVKVCAVDATWSGLRFVYRLTQRPAAVTLRRARRTP